MSVSRPKNPYRGLYIVATPIGNLSDMSLRAIEVLQKCDLILCEDTRVSRKLLEKYDITTPLKPYHDHNGEKIRPNIIADLKNNISMALISDAGTPLVSDPGYKLVREAHGADIPVTPVPGPSAFLAGLTVSGLPTDKFIFLGFLPVKKGQIETVLTKYLPLDVTQIYYETSKRIEKTLDILKKLCPDREIVIARELTKAYEEILRGIAGELQKRIADRDMKMKGEIVLLISPAAEEGEMDEARLSDIIRQTLKTESVSSAAKTVASTYNLPRGRVYELALKLSGE